ncbi:related to 2,5-dichloro-2,5-cyclohexadiene-1,4-diol dehydrogenase [Phialocephala subalpina]|uniref:Related to 2,5-dichloro-2,5-cyclohexadiene-1,4-diol dehydrogenase n=1 Tax=Phialocephala subalpina TaxID=576137 RepID=A0A1L7XEQ1_9HELO|nr:related to 2,5-dichloro-2,5-cyclohexadiene-1,4-diol dehydrogenase [Phialocephala subalpina]
MDSTTYNVPTKQLFTLQERTILVTGGLGGVGSPVIYSILESGGDVICLDLSPDPKDLDRFHAIASNHGAQFFYYSLNVTDEHQVSKVIDEAISKLRHPLRGVVTAAGTSGKIDAVDYPADAFRKLLDVNVMGTFLVVQAAVRVMQRQKVGGSVVLIASMSGSVANKGVNTSAYNSSKSAILQLARSLAMEWGNSPNHPPIRVNSLSPGYIYTRLSEVDTSNEATRKLWTEGNMLGRISHAEEYRAPILFLLGDGSSFMTGADLRVDGGHCAW